MHELVEDGELVVRKISTPILICGFEEDGNLTLLGTGPRVQTHLAQYPAAFSQSEAVVTFLVHAGVQLAKYHRPRRFGQLPRPKNQPQQISEGAMPIAVRIQKLDPELHFLPLSLCCRAHAVVSKEHFDILLVQIAGAFFVKGVKAVFELTKLVVEDLHRIPVQPLVRNDVVEPGPPVAAQVLAREGEETLELKEGQLQLATLGLAIELGALLT
mmetsp:Transcript_82753/g.208296  ORF Transcript_82753/g.208296 Transcript_82753/m.208296 type:complete len:214 (+) Transcript_82753:695-1336(+)